MNGKKRIAAIGECMIELQQRHDGSLQQGFGGDTLNTAVYLCRELGQQAQVDYVTALGYDSFSDAMCQGWAEEGIGLDKVQRLPGRLPGLYCIQTDARGERRFLYWRNEAAVRDCFNTAAAGPILADLRDYDVLYFSGITLAVLGETGRKKLIELLVEARIRQCLIVFDNNYRPRLWNSAEQARAAYLQALEHVDLALLTLEDEQALFGHDYAHGVFTAYPHIAEVVIKRGAQSCLLRCAGVTHEIPAQKVEQVVDTTAAGDAFSAAYLASRVRGGGPVAAAEAGHRLASRVIQHPGALLPRE
ncbi:sugar kinase [Pseudomonas sp. LD120]|uniref:sugar kinase n=1 Tax=Pseudomonas sp. LD120 TaxID=485751 RepID=UPI00135891F1|nr:sugar kinase [Pseudomonas sp. LD120]KAF0864333.1 sugar kinase [Pseudomonas sp. LD120]